MDVMKRNIENYEQQLIQLFGSALDLSELRQWRRKAGASMMIIHQPKKKNYIYHYYYYYYYMYIIIIIILKAVVIAYVLACGISSHVILKQLTVI